MTFPQLRLGGVYAPKSKLGEARSPCARLVWVRSGVMCVVRRMVGVSAHLRCRRCVVWSIGDVYVAYTPQMPSDATFAGRLESAQIGTLFSSRA